MTPRVRQDAAAEGTARDPDPTGAPEGPGPGGATAASIGRIARGGALNLLGAAVTGLAGFALAVVLTHGLDRADAGVFFSTSSLFLLAMSLGQLGTPTGLVYFISRCRARGRPELVPGFLRSALGPVLLVSVAMAVLVLVLAPDIARVTNPDHVDRAVVYLRTLAVFVPVAVLELVVLAATRGLGTMRAHALVELVARPSTQLALVAVAVATLSPDLAGLAWGLPYVPAAVAAWLWWRRAAAGAGFTRAATERVGRRFWRFTSPRAGTSVMQMAMQRLDIVLVGALAGAVPAAVYAATTRFVVVGQMGNNAISNAAQPGLAVAIAREDHPETEHIYRTSTAWLITLTWPLYLTLAIFGGTLLGVFGRGYTGGAPVLVLLAVAMLLATGFGMVDQLLSMAGRTSWNLANASLALLVQVGLDLLLIPGHGIVGAALGWAGAIVTRNGAALAQVWLALGLHPFARTTATAAALCLGSFAVVPGATALLLGTDPAHAAVGLGLGLVCFAAGLWVCRGVLELSALASVRRRRGARASTR